MALATTAQGFANTLLGASLSFGLNAASTSKAHDRQKNMMTRGPTYIMQGLRDAGINPIIAAGSSGFGGQSARAPQAGSATVPDAGRASLAVTQKRLAEAATAKTLAERDIIAANQPAANWNAAFNLTPTGKTVMQMDRVNAAMPNSWSANAARGLFHLNEGIKSRPRTPNPPWYPGPPGPPKWQTFLKDRRK